MKRLVMAIAFVVVLAMCTTGAWANAVQITLSSSTANSVVFDNNGSSLGFSFNGTCGHASCISGSVLLEPQLKIGTYWMWMTGSPTLTGGPSDYMVNLNGGGIYLSVKLTGYTDVFTATLNLTNLYGGTGNTPTFSGTFSNVTSSGLYLGTDFPSGILGVVDFTVRTAGTQTLSTLSSNQQLWGSVSSGELVPAPEPSSLALLGTSVLGLAGVIRRKLK